MFNQEAAQKIIDATGAPLTNADVGTLATDLQDVADSYDIWRIAFKTPPTEKQRRESFEKIKRAAEGLLKALEVGTEGNLQNNSPHLCRAITQQARRHAEGLYNDNKQKAQRQKAQRQKKYVEGFVEGFPGLRVTPFTSKSDADGKKLTVMFYQESTAVRQAVEGVQRLVIWAKSGLEEMASPDWEQWKVGEGPSAELWLIGKGLPTVYNKHADKPFAILNPWDTKGEAYGNSIQFIQACLCTLDITMKPDAIARQYGRYRESWDN